MNRPLDAGIARMINAKHRVILIGKAGTISDQIKQLAAMNMGRSPWQDVFSHDGDVPRTDYRKHISKEVLK